MRLQEMRRLLAAGFFAVCCLFMSGQCVQASDFIVKEYIGCNWQRECVTFPLDEQQLRDVKAGHALCGADGKAISYQRLDGDTPQNTRIAFQTDLPSYETRAYRFSNDQAVTTTDVHVMETADAITLENSQTGIRIVKKLVDGQGPIAGVRLPSGAWVTGSRLTSDTMVTRYDAKVTAHGPVFAEVACTAMLGKAATWELRLRIYANEPVVLVEEISAVDGPVASFSLDLKRDFNPDMMHYRTQLLSEGYGKNRIAKLADGDVFTLEPWVHWNLPLQGNYFGLYREDGADLLGIAAGDASVWVDPAVPPAKRAGRSQVLKQDAGGLHLDFPLKVGKRKWMYIALPKDPCLVEAKDAKTGARSPLPYQYLVKYGHFPLDMVKEWVLEWDASKEVHPCLLITPKTMDRYLAANKIDDFSPGAMLNTMRWPIGIFINQHASPYGSAPNGESSVLASRYQTADLALRDGVGTPEERQRLRAQLAFIAYAIARPDYWSTERGFALFPNMTTMVAQYRLLAGATLNSHPCAKQWQQAGLQELKREVEEWSDANGGWVETPHYAMGSFDMILGGLLIAHNSFGDETIFSPRVKKIGQWFGKISTPPDTRIGGFRHLPPVGHTFPLEPTGEFGLLAALWKDRDPAFSAEMQWHFQQQGYQPIGVVGGRVWTAPYWPYLNIDKTLPATAPSYRSELFPETGVMLRNVFPSDRETTLYLIAGNNHSHYDMDSGSITIWGKGRIVADEFGYNSFQPRREHSMVDSTLAGGIVSVKEFATAPHLDYIRATGDVTDGWTRQIAYVKDADPMAPNYFIIADSLGKTAPAIWRLWCPAQEVRPSPGQALVVGNEDVDTDIVFLQPGLTPTTEDLTLNPVGGKLQPNGVLTTVRMSLLQKSVSVNMVNGTAVSAVIYPRLKTEAAPQVNSLAGGKGMKIVHAKGTDYVFLAPVPFALTVDGISFEGTVGAVLLRDGKPELILGAPGSIATQGKSVTRK